MTTLFKIIVSMSFSATLVILFILAIRQLLKNHMSKSFVYSLWALVLLRLLLPFSFESDFSVFNLINTSEPLTRIEGNTADGTTLFPRFVDLSKSNALNTPNNSKPFDFTTNPLINRDQTSIDSPEPDTIVQNTFDSNFHGINLLRSIWLIGMFFIFMFFLIHYSRIFRLLNDATHFKTHSTHPVFTSDKVDSPMIHGFIHPKIILPSYYNFNEEELAYVLAHESEHLRRFDYIVKPIALIILCIHWFNPLVWVAFFISMNDMELSCDEKVLEHYDKRHQVNYAKTLLNMSQHQNQRHMNPLVSFGEKNIKARIKSAVSFKNISIKVKLLGIALLIILAVIFISDPRNRDSITSDVIDENTLDEAPYPFEALTHLAEVYNYEDAIVFDETSEEVIVLAYNRDFSNGLLIYTDKDFVVNKVEDFKTNDALTGFDFSFKYGDFSHQAYLLGILSRKTDHDSIDSKIVCIPKNDLSELYILSEYNMPYQSQGEIPTIIDFTLTLSGDYIAYSDIDSYLKVQHIKTGTIYSSNENTTQLAVAKPIDLIHAPIQKYMPVLEYQDGSGYLYFNRETQTFIMGTFHEGSEDTISFDSLSDQLIPLNVLTEHKSMILTSYATYSALTT